MTPELSHALANFLDAASGSLVSVVAFWVIAGVIRYFDGGQ